MNGHCDGELGAEGWRVRQTGDGIKHFFGFARGGTGRFDYTAVEKRDCVERVCIKDLAYRWPTIHIARTEFSRRIHPAEILCYVKRGGWSFCGGFEPLRRFLACGI